MGRLHVLDGDRVGFGIGILGDARYMPGHLQARLADRGLPAARSSAQHVHVPLFGDPGAVRAGYPTGRLLSVQALRHTHVLHHRTRTYERGRLAEVRDRLTLGRELALCVCVLL